MAKPWNVAGAVASAAAIVFGLAAVASGQGWTPETWDERAVRSVGPADSFAGGIDADPSVPTPAEFLGYELGERFTRGPAIVGYLRALAESSDRAVLEEYGRSHQDRPLVTFTVTSPERVGDLDAVYAANRELVEGAREGRPARAPADLPAIVWFSFGVHGNEASVSEAALLTAYTLAAGRDERITRLLDELVVVIDPNMNPDGRARYVSFYEQTAGAEPIAHEWAAEHIEPWPGGRTNHYLFDLNRDWAWVVHPESRTRMEAYRRVRPHLHIDWHEQGRHSPHFFGEGDTPYHAEIPDETREWLAWYTGRLGAEFDARGLVYATRERFDYLYPGYGKVTPCYHGAVGILNEQGGHGRAGLAVEIGQGYVLTLAERVRNQFVVGMRYLESTAERRREQVERFARYWSDSLASAEERAAQGRTFYVSSANDPRLLARVWDVLSAHGIRVERTAEDRRARLRSYGTGEAEEADLPAGSWVVSADQPMGRLVRVLFERSAEIEDPDTYDVTAWSLPVAFGLEAWWSEGRAPGGLELVEGWRAPRARATGGGGAALVVSADQFLFPTALGIATRTNTFARLLGEDIEIDGRSFPAGSLVVHRVRNASGRLDELAREMTASGVSVHRLGTTLTESGPVLGANANRRFIPPRVLLVRGSGTSVYSYGEVWHLFDRLMPAPYVPVNADNLDRVDLSGFNVILTPSAWGDLAGEIGEGTVEELGEWVRGGGTLVAIGRSAEWAQETWLEVDDEVGEGADGDGEDAEEGESDDRPALSELTWAEREARDVEDRVPGAMVKLALDGSHPLAAGLGDWIGVLMRGDRVLGLEDDGYGIARLAEDGPVIAGVMSERNRERLRREPFVTQHDVGGGHIVLFAGDVTTRGFCLSGSRLLMNAALLGPSLSRAEQPLGR